MRETTTEKEKDVLKVFQRLLRCGKDFSTSYIYGEAGAKCYLTAGSAGNIIRKHYRAIITSEMKTFVFNLNGTKHEEKVSMFVKEFNLCKRESRLIIRYIKRSK
jgi:aspartate 1-decarboxylase